MNDFLDQIEQMRSESGTENSAIQSAAMTEMKTAGIEIQKPTYDIPDSPDQKVLDQFPDGGFGAQMAFDGWKNYLKKPIVTDHFADNKDRTKWRVETQDKMNATHGLDGKIAFNEIYKSNKLNGNALHSAVGLIPFIELDENGQQVNEFPLGFPVEEIQNLKQLSKNFEEVKTGETRTVLGVDGSPVVVEGGMNPWDTLPLEDTKVDGQTQKGKLTVATEIEKSLLKITNYLAGK